MAQTVADLLLDRLEEWGIHTIFGYSGDGINGILGALELAGDRFDSIQPRHEPVGVVWQSARQGWQALTTR